MADFLKPSSGNSNDDAWSRDPTVDASLPPEKANGKIPDPFERYGKPLPKEWIPLYRKPMRTPRRALRVVAIGAGISSLNLAHKIYHEHRLIEEGVVSELRIYEANADLGGTWMVNTYPGVACDVPAHIYTFPFEPNPEWSAYYATGAEIQGYLARTVAKYDLARGVKYEHRVQRAEWDETRAKWRLEIQHGDSIVHDECDVFVSGKGFLSKWRWPSIPGLHGFKGHLCHSANWDEGFDWTGMRVGIIGNGSSGIQILPQLVEKAAHVTNFIRRSTYITPGLGSSVIGGKTQYYYSEEEKRRFREDPETLKRHRKQIQAGSNRAFEAFLKNSKMQDAARQATVDGMRDLLGGDEELLSQLAPEYEVGCRRATPGPGYLEAFLRDNVSLVKGGIAAIEAHGIRTDDGTLHSLDAIICATGFDVSHKWPWPLIGCGGRSLADAWSEEEPVAYLSLCAPGFPNFFILCGPNAPVGHGSLMVALNYSADYIAQWLTKIAEEDIASVDVKADVVAEFDAYADEIMQGLVWSGSCQSW